jgi:hypothetical protein
VIMLGLITALALTLQSQKAMNAERYWSLSHTGPSSCTAVARADNGEFVLLGLNGRVSFGVASNGLPQGARMIEVRFDDRRQALPAQRVGALIGERGEGLSSSSIVALRSARTLTVALDGREAMRLDLSGSGTSKLVDDLLDCSTGKSGWWDADARQPAPRGSASASKGDSLLPPAPPNAKPGSIPMGPAGSR